MQKVSAETLLHVLFLNSCGHSDSTNGPVVASAFSGTRLLWFLAYFFIHVNPGSTTRGSVVSGFLSRANREYDSGSIDFDTVSNLSGADSANFE